MSQSINVSLPATVEDGPENVIQCQASKRAGKEEVGSRLTRSKFIGHLRLLIILFTFMALKNILQRSST